MPEAASYRYTDDQVRGDVHFYRATVYEYLDKYTGSFDVLVGYKIARQGGQELTIPQIRTALNCMRHDVNVQGLPEPTGQAMNFSRYSRPARVVDIHTREEIQVTKSVWIPLNHGKMKFEFGELSSPRAYVLHHVDPDCDVMYNTETHEIQVRFRWLCGAPSYYDAPWKRKTRLYTGVQAAQLMLINEIFNEDRKLCNMCDQLFTRKQTEAHMPKGYVNSPDAPDL